MAKEARNHHYLPQCYLKGFAKSASKNASLYVIDIRESKNFQTCPRNVGSQRDFNRIDIEGHRPDAIENALSKFEGQAAQVIERMRNNFSMPNDDDFVVLVNLIALMAIRNPFIREKFTVFQREIVKGIEGMVLAKKERWEAIGKQMKESGEEINESITYEEVKEFYDKGIYDIEIPKMRNIQLEMDGINTILPTLMDRKWALGVANQESGNFVSCDRPVTLEWIDQKLQGSWYPPGHGLKSTEIAFPVSKELALIGTFEGESRTFSANRNIVATFNSRMINFADRHVYSSKQHFEFMGPDGKIHNSTEITKFLPKNA